MRRQLKQADNIRGVVSAEAAMASFAMILLFAVFISIAGYCITAAKVKNVAAEKAMYTAMTMYAVDIDLPVTRYPEMIIKNRVVSAAGLVFYGISSKDSIEVIARYKYQTLFGDIETTVSSVCTLWGGDGKSLSGEESVWNLPPNERGRRIEMLFGGNLPEFFPVIDSFDSDTGEAVCIISIDTSLEVYKTGSEIEKVIAVEAGKLRAFASGSCDGTEISQNEITSRILQVVIPENQLSDIQEDCLGNAVLNAMGLGIIVEVRRFQHAGE